MKIRLIFLSVISLTLAGGAGWGIYQTLEADHSARSATTQAAPQQTVQTVNGETVVAIGPDEQRASHIMVMPLAVSVNQSNITAYATVVDLAPFFDIHNRLAAARADIDTLTVQAANSRAQYQRSRVLFADDRNVSEKSLQDAQTRMQADVAKLQSAKSTLSGLDATTRQQFGDVLTRAATKFGSELFQRLQARRAVVLRVTLPASYGNVVPPLQIKVMATGGQSIPVRRLSASPFVDPAVQGNPWFYIARQAFPVGIRMSANVPTSTPSGSRLFIPEQALVWYGGQAWIFVQTAPDRFTRRYVPAANDGGQGLMMASGLHVGDLVVTQGAQLLLSEELKPQGIATVCNDPPECDD
ncbi:MAG: metal transporter [Herbaspirillum sp.]